MSRRLGRAAVGCLAGLLAAGCGTTVGGAQSLRGGNGTGDLSVPGSTAGPGTNPSAPNGTGALPGSGGSGTGSTTGQGTGTGTGTSAATGGRAGRLTPAAAPGVTSTTISLGLEYCSDCSTSNAALGATGASASYDSRDVNNAIIDYANKHGGFAGRQLKAVYYPIQTSSDRNTQEQSACEHFTRDTKVFAISVMSEIMQSCAEKAGVLGINGGSPETSGTFSRYPHYIDPSGMAFDRMGSVTVNGLSSQHYFTGKLGLITWDDPTYRLSVTNGYLPAFSRHHISLATPPVYVAVPQQIGATADSSASIQSAVTKFKGKGIDHVIIQDGPAGVFGGGGLTFQFMNGAQQQRYFPRYGGNRYNLVGASIYPTSQEDHMLSVDDSDYDPKYDTGWHPNAARVSCFKIETDAGLPPKPGNINDQYYATTGCDMVFLLQRILNRVSVVSTDAFVQSMSGLGTSFASATVYGTFFSSTRHDGSDYVRVEEYLESCSCIRYTGPPQRAD
jgi:hypothetical protein